MPETTPSIEERLARIEADMAAIIPAVTGHGLWIVWLKSMVTQRPESIVSVPDSEVP